MSPYRLMLLTGVLLLPTGCTWPVRQRTDQSVCRMANQPYDVSPENAAQTAPSSPESRAANKPSTNSPSAPANATDRQRAPPGDGRTNASKDAPLDVGTASWLESPPPNREPPGAAGGGNAPPISNPRQPHGVRQVAWLQPQDDISRLDVRTLELHIPGRLPGSETPRIELPAAPLAKERALNELYSELPPMPVEPQMLPGPGGQPYTLTELQRIAAANSPVLRQATADVQRAIGLWQQARTYANPTGTYFVDPTNNNATTGVQGIGVEQVIKTAGKQKLTAAVAQKDVENAQLTLRRVRNDLATQVRQAYFALLVDKETLAVTHAVAHFTDEIYRLQARLAHGPGVANYEPASLRAQAFATRLAYQQAIATYIYDWKALVAAIGVRQLPLTQVAGRIDRFIPYYDYDQVLSYVLQNHSDVLIARNLVPQAKYDLKRAQVAVIPDLDVSYKFARDVTVAPFGTYQQFQIQVPLAIWDRNKGNIVAAQAGLIRATEEQHNVELDLTNRLADAYTNYQNNLYAIDYYRRYILPDLVRYYRGVYARRPLDPDNINVGDLAFAQQNLSQNVTAYLDVLGKMWQSVVRVADFLQTDDLFQMATPRALPELPDFDELSRWACGHERIAASCGVRASGAPAATAGAQDRGELAPPPTTASPPRNDGPAPQSGNPSPEKAGPAARPGANRAAGDRIPPEPADVGRRRNEDR